MDSEGPAATAACEKAVRWPFLCFSGVRSGHAAEAAGGPRVRGGARAAGPRVRVRGRAHGAGRGAGAAGAARPGPAPQPAAGRRVLPAAQGMLSSQAVPSSGWGTGGCTATLGVLRLPWAPWCARTGNKALRERLGPPRDCQRSCCLVRMWEGLCCSYKCIKPFSYWTDG